MGGLLERKCHATGVDEVILYSMFTFYILLLFFLIFFSFSDIHSCMRHVACVLIHMTVASVPVILPK